MAEPLLSLQSVRAGYGDALVLDDYLTFHLNAWTQKLILESEVYGLAMPGGHR